MHEAAAQQAEDEPAVNAGQLQLYSSGSDNEDDTAVLTCSQYRYPDA
jgi:hypothetical protein